MGAGQIAAVGKTRFQPDSLEQNNAGDPNDTSQQKPTQNLDAVAQEAISGTLAKLGLPLINHFLKPEEGRESRLVNLAAALGVVSKHLSLAEAPEEKFGLYRASLSSESVYLQQEVLKKLTNDNSKKIPVDRQITRTARTAQTRDYCISRILQTDPNADEIDAVRQLIKFKALTFNNRQLKPYTRDQKTRIRDFVREINPNKEPTEKKNLGLVV